MEQRKSRRSERAYKGTFEGPVGGIQTSRDGLTQYFRFVLQSCGSRYLVTTFGGVAARAFEFQPGDLISVLASEEAGTDEDGNLKLVGNSIKPWSIQEEREKIARDYAIKTYGSLEKYYEARKKQDESRVASGLVRVTFHDGSSGWVSFRYTDGIGQLLVDRLIEVGGKEFVDYVRKHFTTEYTSGWVEFLNRECNSRGVTRLENKNRVNTRDTAETFGGHNSLGQDMQNQTVRIEEFDDIEALYTQIKGEL